MGLATQARMIDKFQSISLGQGQAVIATEMIKEGVIKVRLCILLFDG